MSIVVAQFGARMHYAVPRIFHEAGILERLFTDSYSGNKPWLRRPLAAVPHKFRPRFLEMWLGRNEPSIPPSKVTSFDMLGFAYARARRRPEAATEGWETARTFSARFQEAVLREGVGAATGVYVMPGTAYRIFPYARSRGLSTIFEQFDHTLDWYFQILEVESDRWGIRVPRISPAVSAEIDQAREREAAAFRSATRVIVASEYTRRTVAYSGYRVANVRVVPYGIDLGRWRPRVPLASRVPGPLRVLFVASLDLRKGILYLLEALKRLRSNSIEFRAAGTIGIDRALLERLVDGSCLLGPVPRTRVADFFHWADIFVLPTLGEGFGLVQAEAIASGTPVIATTECGDVIREGIEGHVVPPRDSDAIARWLDYYAADPSRLEPLRVAALERANFFSLESYAGRLLAALPTTPLAQTG